MKYCWRNEEEINSESRRAPNGLENRISVREAQSPIGSETIERI